MNSALQSINAFSADWSAWLWRVSWQSAIVIAVAWLVALALRRTSPRVRSWVWRIAYLKILVLMVWTTPLRVAILPPSANDSPAISDLVTTQTDGPPINRAAIVGRAEPQPNIASTPLSRDAKAAGAERSPSAESAAIATVNANIAEISQSAHPLGWQSYLLFVWLLGLTVVLVQLIREVIGAVQLRRSVRTVQSAELVELLADLRRQLRVRRTVQLGESRLAGAPLLVKLASPAIVFPEDMLGELDSRELRLALAHELAHLKRRDLTWNALAAIISVLLYFHPLAWLAHRCTRQEQELACDELVITSLGIEREAYGEMLLKVVRRLSRTFPTGMAVVGMASPYQTLSQRIEAMSRFSPLTRRQASLAACGLALLALLTTVPWQIVAQERAIPSAIESSSNDEDATPLADAIKDFNAKAQNDAIGKKQPLVTEAEVLEAILQWDRENVKVSDDVFAIYQEIAHTKLLPKGASLDFTTRWTTDELDAKVWWVDLKVKTGLKTGYAFRVRDHMIDAQPKKNTPPATESKTDNASNPHQQTPTPSDAGATPITATTEKDFPASRAQPDLKSDLIDKLKKLLVGTWTGSYSHDDLTLNDDGTFEHLYEDWGPHTSEDGTPVHNLHFQSGRWTISTQKWTDNSAGTEGTYNALELEILHDDTQAPFWLDSNKNHEKQTSKKQNGWYSIERLDKDLMRLKIHDGPEAIVNWISDGNNKVTYQTASALFYRRVGGTAAPQNYDPKLPESIRRLAVLSRLTPDEAKSLYAVINGRPEDDKPTNMHALLERENIDLIERIDAARHQQINFAQLFELPTDELNAFRELMRLVDDKYATAGLVRDKGNLSPVEDSAMKKLDGLYSQFLNLISASNDDGTGIGTDKQRNPAVSKLVEYLGDLNEWLNVRIYAVGLPWAGSFGGGGGGGFGGGRF